MPLVKNLYILAGVPGCGKSTLAKTLFPETKVISSDEIRFALFGGLKIAHSSDQRKANNRRVFAQYHAEIETTLAYGRSVVADATNLDAESRRHLIEIARRNAADPVLILFANVDTALDRNAARDDETRVPDEVQDRFVSKYWTTLAQYLQEDYARVIRIGGIK